MKKKALLFFLLIILIASLLRLVQLNSNPPEMTWDEVAWGYNAYSLGIDGRDEFGRFLPVQYLESFGDFKPPVYAYLDILPVKLFGLTPFAVRLPSALAGIGTVIMTYFLVQRVFYKSKSKVLIALFSSAVLAISPWHILLSRAAFEANVATFFIVVGLWAFLAGIEDKKWLLLLSSVAFALPFYTFNSPRVFLPLFLPLLVILCFRYIWRIKLQAILAVVLFILLLAPLIPFLLSPQAKLRYDEVNIFSDSSIVETSNQEIANDNNSLVGKIINNRRVLYSLDFMKHYFDEFNPNFLFFAGDNNPKFSIQTTGELYIWCLPFLVAGVLFLFRKREGFWWMLPLWLLIGIIPASTARETPHALRTEVTLPTFQIMIAYSLSYFALYLVQQKKKRIMLRGGLFIISLIIAFESIRFIHSYFVHYPYEYSVEWQYGYKESIAYVEQQQSYYNQIYITDTLGRPYIYYLFYQHIPPSTFRSDSTVTRDQFGFVNVERMGKYYFGTIAKLPENSSHILYIDDPKHLPSSATLLKTFYSLDNIPILIAYTK